MNSIFEWILLEIQTNDMLTGLVGGSLMASLLYSLREVPKKIKNWFWEVTTSSMSLNSEINTNFNEALYLFQNIDPLIRHKNFSIVPISVEDDDIYTDELGLGFGTHYFRLFGVFCKVSLEAQMDAMRYRQTMVITAFTVRGSTFFKNLNKSIQKRKIETRHIYEYAGYWRKVQGAQERNLKSVFLPEVQKHSICKSISSFMDNKQWYLERGIPWRLSLLFDGPPGTGKTSLAVALASEFKLPLYYLSLSTLQSDIDLFNSMRNVPSRCIVVIEDIDCAFLPGDMNRVEPVPVSAPQPLNGCEATESPNSLTIDSGITLSGLLNSIDGILAPQGRILIMTTNHVENLDPALLRPGRVDLHETFGHDKSINTSLFLHITDNKAAIPENIESMTPAEVQSAAIQFNNGENYEG